MGNGKLENISVSQEALVEILPFGVVCVNPSGDIVFTNQFIESMFGFEPTTLVGEKIETLMPARYRKSYLNYIRKFQTKPRKRIFDLSRELFGLQKGGMEFPIEVHLSAIHIDEKSDPYLIACVLDISKYKHIEDNLILTKQINESNRHLRELIIKHTKRSEKSTVELFQAKEQLFQEKERIHVTLESIADGVITSDIEGNIQYLNPIAEQFINYENDKVRGLPAVQVFSIVDEETHYKMENPIMHVLRKSKGINLDSGVLVNDMGQELIIEYSVAPIQNKKKEIIGAVMVFHDMTETRKLMEQFSYQATHDMLTNLINRHEFDRRLETAIHSVDEENVEHALLYIDIDQFKVVNDTCGHVAGDELLRQIAEALKNTVRKKDTLARLGGDEFGVLLEYCSQQNAYSIAEKIIKAIRNISLGWDKHTFRVGASVGLVPINNMTGDFKRLMSLADSACYAAKDAGRDRIYVYKEDDTEIIRRHSEMGWASHIDKAIEEDRLYLCWQEIRSLDESIDNKKHFEVLLRLRDEEGKTILPGAFLPAAERYNLITTIDEWVVKKTFQLFNKRPELFKDIGSCAINLSGKSIVDKKFIEVVQREFEEQKIPPEKICFEITETATITNLTSAIRFINILRDYGCKFSLDDFGSGMSSFGYLKNMPLDFIKIDGIFVRNIVDDPISLAFVKSINEIGHIMNMKTIAEFVESENINNKLKEVGVDYVQGNWISCPKPIEEE